MDIKDALFATLLLSQTAFANEKCVAGELRFTFNKLDIKTAFSILADFSGSKLVIDPSISWTGPLNFGCTPWRKVAEDLARTHNLTLEIKDGTMYVAK
jgi:hypothetical protein